MNLLNKIKLDYCENKSNPKILIFLFFFRISNAIRNSNLVIKTSFFWFRLFYKICIEWNWGIDFPDNVNAGAPLKLYHAMGLVVNSNVIIKNNVTIRHNTTIGNKYHGGKSPVIENNVDIGSNAIILGDIIIGENSKIAAGSVVVHNVPPNTIVAGNPAKEIKKISIDI
jgi:putative colanic acid biosynthesis acetyltransferase WcaB